MSQSSWRPAELVRELAGAIPTTVAVDATELTELSTEARRRDCRQPLCRHIPLRPPGTQARGRSTHHRTGGRPGAHHPAILDEEEELIAWAERRSDQAAPRRKPRPIRFAEHLTPAQVAAVAAVTDGAGLELMVGPAGAGKTTTLATAVLNVTARGRIVFGVAPTAAAAEVLATEAGIAPTQWTSCSSNTPIPADHRNPATTCRKGPR